MPGPTIEELQCENVELREQLDHLRKLIIRLSATLLRRTALDLRQQRPYPDAYDAKLLVYEAEECFRFARLPGLREKIAEGLEAAGQELLGKAVEAETKHQRGKWKNGNTLIGPH